MIAAKERKTHKYQLVRLQTTAKYCEESRQLKLRVKSCGHSSFSLERVAEPRGAVLDDDCVKYHDVTMIVGAMMCALKKYVKESCLFSGTLPQVGL